jgi:hypothetical protein
MVLLQTRLGPHVGCCIAMQKPVVMVSSAVISFTMRKDIEDKLVGSSLDPAIKKLEHLLRSNDEMVITDEMREVIEPFGGLREKKTKEELRQIFYEAEQLFQKSPNRRNFLEFR